jgi:hypothetical protein
MVVLNCGIVGKPLRKKKGFFLGKSDPLEAWQKPYPRLRLDQVAYLGAHNAHANVEEGFVYAQQLWSLENQLKRGVRHFLLDIWLDKGQLLLCHNKCTISKLLKLGRKHKDLRSALVLMKNWLDKHPDEIITLELENYTTGDQTYEVIKSVPGLEPYILKHSDYEPLSYKGKWPTIQNLVNRNKRLIIFDTRDNENYAFDTNLYMIRNMYGTLNVDKAARLREVKRPNRGLYQLNYFGTITSPSPRYNRPEKLKELLKRVQEKGVVPSGKNPNFIALDFVDRGNAMKWVNELNREAALRMK